MLSILLFAVAGGLPARLPVALPARCGKGEPAREPGCEPPLTLEPKRSLINFFFGSAAASDISVSSPASPPCLGVAFPDLSEPKFNLTIEVLR